MSLYTELRTKVVGAPLDPLSAYSQGGGTCTGLAIQRRLHLHGMQMVILPMKI